MVGLAKKGLGVTEVYSLSCCWQRRGRFKFLSHPRLVIESAAEQPSRVNKACQGSMAMNDKRKFAVCGVIFETENRELCLASCKLNNPTASREAVLVSDKKAT